MTLPGPSGIAWAVELLLFGAMAAFLGELVRVMVGRRVPLLRNLDPLERGLVDLYLGGAVLYLLAALPVGVFGGFGVVFVTGALLGFATRRLRPVPIIAELRVAAAALGRYARRPEYLLTAIVVLALFSIEVSSAEVAATGNTYDSSLLALYTSLLLQHHTLPLTLAPVTSVAVIYPQGTTVWLSAAQALFGLPPARTSVLVTPLFLALGPVGAFSFGSRLAGGPRAGLGFALVFALLAPFTRGLVGGSNDFVLAFPLVLFLAGRSALWTGDRVPGWPDCVSFGALAGCAAALNPVGVQWLFVTLPVLALLSRPRWAGSFRAWATRWAAAIGAALVFLLPTLAVLLAGRTSPSFTSGASPPLPGTPIGVGTAQFIGGIDPFLFRTNDTWLSPFPVLRTELAVLLVVGALLLLAGRPRRVAPRLAPFGRFALAGGVGASGLIAAAALARPGIPGFTSIVFLTNATEASILLFSLYAAVAAIPVVVLLERGESPPAPAARPSAGRRGGGWALPLTGAGALVVAALLLVPGAAVTADGFPAHLDDLYGDFSNVSAADFDLLAWSGDHLPSGSRVVVAPGSIAEFLPAYAPGLALLYPMVPNFDTINASYAIVVQSLTNGTLSAAGASALQALRATVVVVTENNSVLFPAFSPAPLLASPMFCELFHEADAYVFAVTPSAAPGTACGT